MEPNENIVQEDPVQTVQEEPQSILTQPALYNPAEAARMAEVLRESFDPEYILLFGSLCGGTPHSDVTAYDLLVVTREEPHYGWPSAKRYLKYELPLSAARFPTSTSISIPRNSYSPSFRLVCGWLVRKGSCFIAATSMPSVAPESRWIT